MIVVRTAEPGDVPAMAQVWAAAVPYFVRSAASIAHVMAADRDVGRRRTVAVLDGQVIGTATSFLRPDDVCAVQLAVDPEHRGRGAGTALYDDAMGSLDSHGAPVVEGVANDDPASLAFATRRGFAVSGEHMISGVDPRTVDPVGPPPDGLEPVRCDRLPDTDSLLATHNASAKDDPSGHSRVHTPAEFRSQWWDSPDNAIDLSWAMLHGQTVAAFTSVQVDRERGRAWSSMTATHPSYRRRGLATWAKRATLNSLADAGVTRAMTANDVQNAPMLAVNDRLGYRPIATLYAVRRQRSSG